MNNLPVPAATGSTERREQQQLTRRINSARSARPENSPEEKAVKRDIWQENIHFAKVYEDNETAIKVMLTGRNPTMKHLHRVHGVSLAALHDMAGPGTKQLFDVAHSAAQ